ncbi:MAG: DUF1460 domain-containing protein [Chthonomonas sp.]|nr:DUF1460 domain-containing protein [Chthonomonas sp.]
MLSALLSISLVNAQFEGSQILQEVTSTAEHHQWQKLPVGVRMANIGQLFIGTPYVGATLDQSADQEACVVTLKGLDCVTFMESSLGLARAMARGPLTAEGVLREVTYTRYRGGKVDGYLSRLHYTTDWIRDNLKKGVVEDLSATLPGAKKLDRPLYFMSSHSASYKQLAVHPELVPQLKRIEAELTLVRPWYVPRDRVAESASKLQSGDIVALVDTREGLDYAHVGMILVKDGVPHFMHASSAKKEVTLDTSISEYLNQNPKIPGISVVRPLEPKG